MLRDWEKCLEKLLGRTIKDKKSWEKPAYLPSQRTWVIGNSIKLMYIRHRYTETFAQSYKYKSIVKQKYKHKSRFESISTELVITILALHTKKIPNLFKVYFVQ